MSEELELAQDVANDIETDGRLVQIKRVEKGPYDPINNIFGSGTSILFDAKTLGTFYKTQDIDGEVIKKGDKRYLMSPFVDIRVGDTIVDGFEYHVIDIEEIKPGNQAYLLKVQARR